MVATAVWAAAAPRCQPSKGSPQVQRLGCLVVCFLRSDLGCHIDGFIATQATTIVVGSGAEAIKGRAADVIQAAKTAFDAAVRLIRPGKKVSDVSGPLQKVAETFGCNMVEGVMSHELKQFIIDSSKCVLNKPTPENKVEDVDFEENEVYAIDIVVSTGEGKPKVRGCMHACSQSPRGMQGLNGPAQQSLHGACGIVGQACKA